jgi:hypothetical protein
MDDLERVKFPPPDDTAMLPWYQGAFSHGFIALHPFFTVKGLDPAACDYGTIVLKGSDRPNDAGLLEWTGEQSAKRAAGKELVGGSIAEISKRFGRRIGWREMIKETEMKDHCALDCALRTNIMGLKRELENKEAAKKLISYCAREKIFLPTEGDFQPSMESDLVSIFHRAGLTEIVIGDQHGDDEKLISVASLANASAWETREDLVKWGARRLMAPDQSMLVWVHWDSFYTAVFGTEKRLRDLRLSENFEGFWCSDESTTYWLIQDAIPLVQ